VVHPSASLDEVTLDIEEILRPRHSLAPSDPNDFSMFTPIQVQTLIRSGNRVFTVLLPLIAAISLIVGAIVVANLMLMSVSERRAEIGLRKAVGAKRCDITSQFLLEALVVTVLGGVLALGIGWLVLGHLGASGIAVGGADEAARLAAHVSLGLPWEVALLGIGAAIAVGLVAGVVPARRAAELDPVDTLR
jgi:putative ABC transport system permease protein